MIIVGLTGSIGSGKSFIANFLKLKRIPIYYADKEANKILENDTLIKKKIMEKKKKKSTFQIFAFFLIQKTLKNLANF